MRGVARRSDANREKTSDLCHLGLDLAAFVVLQQCDRDASSADNVVLSAEQWRALNTLAVHRIDQWHIGGANAAAVRPIQFVPSERADLT